MNFPNYDPEGFYDEPFANSGTPRSGAALLVPRIDGLTDGELRRRQEAAELALLNMEITFNVYGEETGTERGWRGFDPSLGIAVSNRHVAIAHGPSHAAAHPCEGSYRGTGVTSTLQARIRMKMTKGDSDPGESA